MSKRATCDNPGCPATTDLDTPYQTIPHGWYSLTLRDRITTRDVCGVVCLAAVVAAEEAQVAEQVAARVAELARRVEAGGVPT